MKGDKRECWNCGEEYDEEFDFCPECEAGIEPDETEIPLPKNKATIICKNKKLPQNAGAWILRNDGWFNTKVTDPPLYTTINADAIKHKATGKKYKRGEYKQFDTERGETPPPLIEDTEEYEFYKNARFPFGLSKYQPKKNR